MAQIVIFAPKGEDVSTGEQALKDAGHQVEVVEATASNLLHMAVGMIEADTDADTDAAADVDTDTDTEVDDSATDAESNQGSAKSPKKPEEKDAKSDKAVVDPEPKNESLGIVEVDGEPIQAYLTDQGRPLLRTTATFEGMGRVTYSINDVIVSSTDRAPSMTISSKSGTVHQSVTVAKTGGAPHLLIDLATAKRLKLK